MRARTVIVGLGGVLLMLALGVMSLVEQPQPMQTIKVQRGDLESLIRVSG